jgi:hypothetical protein
LDVDPARLSHDERLELLERIEQTRSALDAKAQITLAHLAGEGDAETRAKEWVREEIACALSIAPATAASRLHDATELTLPMRASCVRVVDGCAVEFVAVQPGASGPRRPTPIFCQYRRALRRLRASRRGCHRRSRWRDGKSVTHRGQSGRDGDEQQPSDPLDPGFHGRPAQPPAEPVDWAWPPCPAWLYGRIALQEYIPPNLTTSGRYTR